VFAQAQLQMTKCVAPHLLTQRDESINNLQNQLSLVSLSRHTAFNAYSQTVITKNEPLTHLLTQKIVIHNRILIHQYRRHHAARVSKKIFTLHTTKSKICQTISLSSN